LEKYRYTSGELATSNFYQIQKVQQIMSRLITREEVEKQYHDLMSIEHTNQDLQKKYQNIIQITNTINHSQTELLSQFQQQEIILQRKIDRSELHNLQSLTAKVIAFHEFQLSTESQLASLQTWRPIIDHQNQETQSTQQAMNTVILSIQQEIQKMASRRDLHAIAKELKNMDQRINLCTKEDHFLEVNFVLYYYYYYYYYILYLSKIF
jgi:hypothetical protein